MCGILGIYNYGNTRAPVNLELLARMRDTMTHRGPADAGSWVSPNGRVGLAHRRLSIIDLSPDGRQPMHNEDQTVWVTFNGEIYNYRHWQEVLQKRGHRFSSRSDTEVILHLYEDEGVACPLSLDGMFAFGLWGQRKEQLLLVRDRLGVKPLYYTPQQGMLLFASEIKALLAHPLIGRDVDAQALYHYLTFKTTPAPLTLFRDIRKLPAGCVLTCDRDGNTKVSRYWDPISSHRLPIEDVSFDDAAKNVREMLTASVQKRMVADVPVGVFLSGGLDSSAIVALASSAASGPLRTYSVGINDVEGCNELEYARVIAKRFGTDHQEIVIGRRELEDYLPQLVHHQDEPLADPVCVPLFYLSRLARQRGTVVVQVGEGSDEQFLGYESRLEFLQGYEKNWRRLLALPPSVRASLHAIAGWIHTLTGWGGRYYKALERAASGRELFWGSVAFDEQSKAHVLNGNPAFIGLDSQTVIRQLLQPLREAWPKVDIATEVSYLDVKLRLAELLLMRIDKVTMSCGVEAREPFLDYRLVEYLMLLPRRLKIGSWEPKALLKRAMENIVPPQILRRPKMAFAAPVNAWLRCGLEPFARQVLLGSSLRERGFFNYETIESMLGRHVEGKEDFGVPLWSLMNLSAWYDHWIQA